VRIIKRLWMSHPGVTRAPWRFAASYPGAVRVVQGHVEWNYAERGSLPGLYQPGHPSTVSISRNLASIVDDESALELVAASLGPLLVDQFDSGYREPLSTWMETARQMRDSRQQLEDGRLDVLSKAITANIEIHGTFAVYNGESDWIYAFDDLIGVAWYEIALDFFAQVEHSPREYAPCQVCGRWFFMTRRDQVNCSSACNNKAHRDRRDEA
jgi:hypothetical protein